MAPSTAPQTITLQPMNKARLTLRIVGDTPLVTHRFDEKARKQIADKQGGEPERLYAHVTTEKLDAYVTSARIAGDVELQEALLREAVSYLRGAQKRYGELSALKGVWQALDEIDSAD